MIRGSAWTLAYTHASEFIVLNLLLVPTMYVQNCYSHCPLLIAAQSDDFDPFTWAHSSCTNVPPLTPSAITGVPWKVIINHELLTHVTGLVPNMLPCCGEIL